ncbi:MAG: hypothetical protein IAG13_08565 [Deltaproteobacteria bacterium]|nr:hypothetical protein [Nannocystaceae bacterium]
MSPQDRKRLEDLRFAPDVIAQADEDLLDAPEICIRARVHDASGNVTLNAEDPSNIFPASVED